MSPLPYFNLLILFQTTCQLWSQGLMIVSVFSQLLHLWLWGICVFFLMQCVLIRLYIIINGRSAGKVNKKKTLILYGFKKKILRNRKWFLNPNLSCWALFLLRVCFWIDVLHLVEKHNHNKPIVCSESIDGNRHRAELLRDEITRNTKQPLSSQSPLSPGGAACENTNVYLFWYHAGEGEVARRRAAFFLLSTVLISWNTNVQKTRNLSKFCRTISPLHLSGPHAARSWVAAHVENVDGMRRDVLKRRTWCF